MSLIKETEKYLDSVIRSCGYEDFDCKLLTSSQRNLGQFQINVAMPLAGIYHKNPRDIAQEIKDKLDDRFVNVNIAGPGFINLSFNDDVIIDYINNVEYQDIVEIIEKVFNKENIGVCIVGKDVENISL